MPKRVFVSYSSKDKAEADAICAALEGAGISCWIAPRDLHAGERWGAGIVRAIAECEAVAVVFSSASNGSPQVAREMELSVSNRRPLVPIRVENVMPTDDMQFFLGVSHWFDAYANTIQSYLPQIVASVKSVLARESGAWNKLRRRVANDRKTLIGLAAVAVVVVAVLTAMLMRPPNPLEAMKSPLAGRWRTEIATPTGKTECILNVEDMGQATYTDGCPAPLMGASGNFNVVKSGVWAPQLYREGSDTGTMLFQGGTAHGYAAAFRVRGSRLTTRDDRQELNWRRISSDKPLRNASADIVPNQVAWPLSDVPGVAKRGLAYARAKWKPDAVLMSIDVKFAGPTSGASANLHSPEGGVELTLEFYSPESQAGLGFRPGSSAGELLPEGTVDRDPRRALPADFLDLPQAVDIAHSLGMRGKQVSAAQLENWSPGTRYGRAQLGGLQWMIDSALNERYVVNAGR